MDPLTFHYTMLKRITYLLCWSVYFKPTDGLRMTRKHKDEPCEIWRLHELHQRSSAINAKITTALSQELSNRKVADFDYPTKCLDDFDTKLKKFNEISVDKIPPLMMIDCL